MTLRAGDKLALNFTAHELGADKPEATDAVVENLRRVAGWLQTVRGFFGRRIFVTSGYRTPQENTLVGGEPTSDHVTGLAADFEVEGLTPFEVYQQLANARRVGTLPAFDQIVFYALDNHVHVGLGARMRGELLLKTGEGSYVQLAGAYLTKLRGFL